jgi:hypothetical protein
MFMYFDTCDPVFLKKFLYEWGQDTSPPYQRNFMKYRGGWQGYQAFSPRALRPVRGGAGEGRWVESGIVVGRMDLELRGAVISVRLAHRNDGYTGIRPYPRALHPGTVAASLWLNENMIAEDTRGAESGGKLRSLLKSSPALSGSGAKGWD